MKSQPDKLWLHPYVFRGNNKKFREDHHPFLILGGPAETGKTITSLCLLHEIALRNKNLRAAIIRQIRESMYATVLQSFEEKILPEDGVCIVGGKEIIAKPFGGKRPSWYDYSNGSRIFVVGMNEPGNILSGELDLVYINQAEDLEAKSLQYLITRTTGRAGNIKTRPPGIIGDCNPVEPTHPIKMWSEDGRIKLVSSQHKDNPSLYDDDGNLTEQGKISISRLSGLRGMERKRLFEGLWVQSEHIIYDTWSTENISSSADYVPGNGQYVWGVDDGYAGEFDSEEGRYTGPSHPRVFLLAQLRDNGILCIFGEHYAIKLVEEMQIEMVLDATDSISEEIKERIVAQAKLQAEEDGVEYVEKTAEDLIPSYHTICNIAGQYGLPDFAVVDKSAAQLKGRLTMKSIGHVNGAPNVDESIKILNSNLAPDGNGIRGVLVHPRCTTLIREMSSYVRNPATRRPIKYHDHGPDALRYLSWVLLRSRTSMA